MIKNGLLNSNTTNLSHDPLLDGEIETYQDTNPAQQEIWTTQSLLPESTLCYNECLVIAWKNDLNLATLQKAFLELVLRHASLRSTFSPDGQIQMFHKLDSKNEKNFFLQVVNTTSNEGTIKTIDILAEKEVQKPFALTHGAPIRLTAISENDHCHYVIICFHHIICDGESAYLLIKDLAKAYQNLTNNTFNRQPAQLPFTFEKATTETTNYWRTKLKSLAHVATFKHLSHKKRGLFRTFNSQRFDLTLNAFIGRGLQQAARKKHVSLFSLLLTNFKITLAKINQQSTVTLGICTSNHSELVTSAGHRVVVRPMQSHINNLSSFNDNLKKIDHQIIEVLESPSIGYGELVSLIENRSQETGTSPLFSIVFNFDQNTTLPELVDSVKTYPRAFENFEIFVNIYQNTKNEIFFEVQYNTTIFEPSEIRNLFEQFQSNLEENIHDDTVIEIRSASILEKKLESLELDEQILNNEDQEILNKILGIWQRRLRSSTLTPASHFFNSGGHSILALEIAKEISTAFSVPFNIKDVFINPTPQAQMRALNQLITSTKKEAIQVTENTPSERNETFDLKKTDHLSVAQQQIMFLEQSKNVGALHNLPAALSVQGSVDLKRLSLALMAIIGKNEALRTYFKRENGKITRKVAAPQSLLNFEIEELRSTKEEILALLNASAQTPFDLSQWPLMSAKLCYTNCGETLLYFNFHHIIWDGWSFDLFFEELNRHYIGLGENFTDLEAQTLNNSFSKFANYEQNYLKSKNGDEDRAYWKNVFAKPLVRQQLPTLSNFPANDSRSASAFELHFTPTIRQKLKNFIQSNSVSVYSVLLTCFKITLAKYSESTDIVVGVPVQNRINDSFKKSFGYFVNTLPVRSQINLDESFSDILVNVQRNFLESLNHQQLPFYEIQRMVTDENRSDFMMALFSFQEVSQREAYFNNKPYTQVNLNNRASHTPLDMWVKFSNSKMEGALQYNDQLFSISFIENFADLYMHILETVLDKYTKSLRSISVSQKQKDLLCKWGIGLTKENKVTVLDFFKNSVNGFPNKTAVSCDKITLSYAELDALSDRIATRLRAHQGQSQLKVGVCLERTSHLPAVLMAIFKCGFTYIPLDHTFPIDRLHYIVADSELDVLIIEKNLNYRPRRAETKVIYLSQLTEKSGTLIKNSTATFASAQDTAYILYTSGTTGTPKGVSVSYSSLQNFVLAMQETGIIRSDDKVLAHTTICFDISFLEILVPILSGAAVHLVNKTDILLASDLNKIIESRQINFIQATPSAWKLLMAQSWKPVLPNFKILSGGERLPQEVADYLNTCSKYVYNMYGPTETTIWSSYEKLEAEKPVTCGSPIFNTQFIVLGQNYEALPPHASGELYIGGAGVSSGYYHKEELTEKKFKFITSPLASGIYYATGDLARWDKFGKIEILGRNDRQIKINGFRLELLEIESHLRKLHVFKDVHVFVLTTGENQTIAAALVMDSGRTISADKIRNELLQHIPHYMIPHDYLFIDEIPRTSSQKIDENTLSFLIHKSDSNPAPPSIVSVRADSSEIIRNLWCQHLEITGVQDHQSFFELGGHSLVALNLNTHLEEVLETKIPLRYLIESKNFKDFCVRVNSLNDNSKTDTKALVILKNGLNKSNTLFCFHAVGGSALNYSILSSYIDPDQYLVGFQSVALNGITPMKSSIEEMCKDYVEELLEFQPEGPYSLCGGSMGGTLAYEVAQQLKAKGHKIEKLILFDTFGPDVDLTKFSAPFEKAKELVKKIIYPKKKIIKPIELIDQITAKNYELLFKYKAKRYQGDLYLIKATRTLIGSHSEPYMGWKSAIDGRIHIIEIRAPHEAFIEDPNFKDAFIKFYRMK